MRTESTSTEVRALGAFDTSWQWGTAQDVRDYTHIAVFFESVFLGQTSQVEIVIAWSDDGTTIAFADDDNYQQSDFNISSFTDGSFKPKTYTAFPTSAGGELVVDQWVHLVFPIQAGFCRVGIRSNAANGNYQVRTQRLVA